MKYFSIISIIFFTFHNAVLSNPRVYQNDGTGEPAALADPHTHPSLSVFRAAAQERFWRTLVTSPCGPDPAQVTQTSSSGPTQAPRLSAFPHLTSSLAIKGNLTFLSCRE